MNKKIIFLLLADKFKKLYRTEEYQNDAYHKFLDYCDEQKKIVFNHWKKKNVLKHIN